MGNRTRRTPTVRVNTETDQINERPDTLAVEEPLEIRVDSETVVSTMRTPGDDLDLATGWLLAEHLIESPAELRTAMHCTDLGPDGSPTFNVLELQRQPGLAPLDLGGRRNFAMNSACGVCGSATIDTLRERGHAPMTADTTVAAPIVAVLPNRLRAAQQLFDRTGGVHAAGLARTDGTLIAVREDVGRHNAADKVLGWAAREIGWPLADYVLVLSGRASFELVQKAWAAGVPIVVAVSAPSSLAVEVAEAAGITLVGFNRAPRFVVYSHPGRIELAGSHSTRPTTNVT